MQLDKVFEQTLEKYENDISFSECFDKLLNDLMDGFRILNQYLGNDKLIENLNKYYESQEDLVSTFKEKIKNIDYDIKLIKSKVIKGKLPNIRKQNNMLISLLRNVLSVDSSLFSNNGNVEEKTKAKPLYNKMRSGLKVLEKAITDYNIKAEKNHSGKLITVVLAREKAIQELKDYIESIKKSGKV